MHKLVVRLLGGYRVELGEAPVYGFETDKARALLAYLVVEADRPHRREALASLLWPDRPDAIARANLRQTIARLRRALHDDPPTFLFVTSTDIQFNTASDYELDVTMLEDFGHSATQHRELLPASLTGDFLAGFAVPDSEAFQAWVLGKQEHYHRLALEILDEQNAYWEANRYYEAAAAAARLQLQLEPWLEEAHRRCMRALALAGRTDEALRQYEQCCRALNAELGSQPSGATRALYAEIRSGQFMAPPPRKAGRTVEPPNSPVKLVARQAELDGLYRHLDLALAGEAQIVLVKGDRGSGKTTLLEDFADRSVSEAPDLLVAATRCSPGGSLDPLAPLRKTSELLFGNLETFASSRLFDKALVERLRAATPCLLDSLRKHGPALVDTLISAQSVSARFAGAPGMPGDDLAEWANAHGPKAQTLVLPGQGELLDQFARTLTAIAKVHPLLLLIDDLQWVDEATAQFLLRVTDELARSRLLLLGAFRSGSVAVGREDLLSGETMRHPLASVVNELRRRQGEILVDLDRADGRSFVEEYVDTEPNRLGAHFRDALYAQTGGHALFTVELLRNLQQRGEVHKDAAGRWLVQESLNWGALPVRVEAAIAERIERLPQPARRLLTAASVEGDEFSAEVAAQIVAMTGPEAIAWLSGSLARDHHLVRAEAVQHLAEGQRSIYRFAHHLFQKYLYDQLDPVQRSQLHAMVAAALERQARKDPAQRLAIVLQLAWHYEQAGLGLEAASALYDAGRQAMRVAAFRDALSTFERALVLLRAQPPSAQRRQLEAVVEAAQIVPQRVFTGAGSSMVEGMVARATREWAAEAQGQPLLMILWAQAENLYAKGKFQDCLEVAGHLLHLATELGEEEFAVLAHYRFAVALSAMGYPQQAEQHFDSVFRWQTADRRATLRSLVGLDLMPASLPFSALNCWCLGFPQRAAERIQQALAAAQEQSDPYMTAFAAGLGVIVHFLLRSEATAVEECAELCGQLCLKHGYAYWQVFADVGRGRVMAMRGDGAAGVEHIRSTVATWQNKGMAVGTDSFVMVLADTCLAVANGSLRADAATRKSAVTAGLAAIDTLLGPERILDGSAYEPELRRLRGELMLAQRGADGIDDAEADFRAAAKLAQERGARAWELRVILSHVRCLHGKASERAVEYAGSVEQLKALVQTFSEGQESPDVQDARRFLRRTSLRIPSCHPG